MNGQTYIQSVIDHVPYGLPLRDHIAMELRSHIAERTEHGQPIDEVVRQLGDPLTLAESYLAAVPLENAPIERRIAAKLIDAALALGVVGSITLVAWALVPREAAVFLPVLAILTCVLGFVTYTAMAEYRYGRTFGKRLMGIHVVRESGARIGLGQAIVRQHIGAALGRRQMAELDGWHLGQAELTRGEQPAVAGNDAAVAIDQDRVGKAELADGRGDLGDLRLEVGTRIAGIGDQIHDWRRFVRRE